MRDTYNKKDHTHVSSLNTYLHEIRDIPVLSNEETIRLIRLYRNYNDNAAMQKLVKSNLRLVVKIAKGYYNSAKSRNDFMDMIQEGNLGLIDAILHYDPDRGTKLSSVIRIWVDKRIKEYLQNNSVIKESDSIIRIKKRINKSKQDYEMLYGHSPSDTELCEFDKTLSIHEIARARNSLSKNDIVSLSSMYHSSSNYKDTKCTHDMRQFVPGYGQVEEQEDYTDNIELKLAIEQIIGSCLLTEQEKTTLILRYGLKSGEFRTQQSTADEIGIARQRCQKIEKHAIAKIRKSGIMDDFY